MKPNADLRPGSGTRLSKSDAQSPYSLTNRASDEHGLRRTIGFQATHLLWQRFLVLSLRIQKFRSRRLDLGPESECS
jgi:hypothetical protein